MHYPCAIFYNLQFIEQDFDWGNYENFKSENLTDGEGLTVQRKQRKQVFIFKISRTCLKFLTGENKLYLPITASL